MKKILALCALAAMLGGCETTGELVGGLLTAMPEAMNNVNNQNNGAQRPSGSYPAYPAPTYPVRRDSSVTFPGIR